ncbi:MAG TPA: hypothetical protein VFZ11_00505 [Gemmatimonadaceae bacterium]
MRITLPVLVLLFVACAPDGEDAAASAGGDSAHAPTEVARAPAAADSAAATSASVAALNTLCASVSPIVARALSIQVARDTGSVFPAPRGGAPWRGCTLRGEGTDPRDSPGPRPGERLVAAMAQDGWEEDVDYQADGPDGPATAMRRGATFCHIQQWWAELPMDFDSIVTPESVPPTIDYVIEILCMPAAPPPFDG